MYLQSFLPTQPYQRCQKQGMRKRRRYIRKARSSSPAPSQSSSSQASSSQSPPPQASKSKQRHRHRGRPRKRLISSAPPTSSASSVSSIGLVSSTFASHAQSKNPAKKPAVRAGIVRVQPIKHTSSQLPQSLDLESSQVDSEPSQETQTSSQLLSDLELSQETQEQIVRLQLELLVTKYILGLLVVEREK